MVHLKTTIAIHLKGWAEFHFSRLFQELLSSIGSHSTVAMLMADYCPQKSRPRREYHLSSKAPPAITLDSLQELGVASERVGITDNGARAGFSGRGDQNDSLQRQDFGKFVQFFRMSSSYIAGHRSNLFVICLPGEVGLCSICGSNASHSAQPLLTQRDSLLPFPMCQAGNSQELHAHPTIEARQQRSKLCSGVLCSLSNLSKPDQLCDAAILHVQLA